MGQVFLASDSRLDREVAIKLLPESFANDSLRMARFEREAKLLASLNHPNIAAIYGVEEADGRKALVMEYVPGEDLAKRLLRGPLPIDEALDIAVSIARALEGAHASGVVHRDLKPANVVLRPDGQVKLLDLGLAKSLEAGQEDGLDPSGVPDDLVPGHAAGPDPRHGSLHVARAGAGQDGRRPYRRILLRMYPVRADRGRPGVQRRGHLGNPGLGHQGRHPLGSPARRRSRPPSGRSSPAVSRPA